MAEQHYVFLKNNRVMQIAVFASQDEELADRVAQEQGYDDAVWVGENKPIMFSTWNGTLFIDPTLDDLYDLGVSLENQAMHDARVLAAIEAANNPE
jgi:hypothetical protein